MELRRRAEIGRLQTQPTRVAFASGTDLVVYVFMSSKCHYCTSDSAKAAIRALRGVVRHSAGARYAAVQVVGVALDADTRAELSYVEQLGHPEQLFDELSIGGSWLNRNVAEIIWRDGFARPAIPAVVVTEQAVDASQYPDHITVGDPSVLFQTEGADVVSWVNRGAPLPTDRRTASATTVGHGPDEL